jgi:hypothetical protein
MPTPWKCPFSWKENLVAPLIAAPNVDRAIEDKNDRQNSYATGYMCNSRLQKGFTIIFCKQIGQSPSTNYASSLSGFKIMGNIEMVGAIFPPIFVLKTPSSQG